MDDKAKKKLKAHVMLMLGGSKGQSDDGDVSDDETKTDETGSDKTDAAQELIDAIKSGDAEAVSSALSAHYAACKASSDDS